MNSDRRPEWKRRIGSFGATVALGLVAVVFIVRLRRRTRSRSSSRARAGCGGGPADGSSAPAHFCADRVK